MAFKRILQFPDPKLRKTSSDVDFSVDNVNEMLSDLVDTLDVAAGAGLAAPQIGYSKNIVIIQPRSFGVDNPDPYPPKEQFMVLVNPKMNLSEEKITWPEACLSVPMGQGNVERSKTCEVEYCRYDGTKTKINLDWPLSAALQHECDHLVGKLFIDRISKFSRDSIVKKITKNAKKKEREEKLKKEQEILDLYGPAGLRNYRKNVAVTSGTKKKPTKRKKKPKTFGRNKKK